ncbi:PD40 domain-containing protein [Dactylosporangium vinaceum]|uniref:TolB family protein n=1 Tax=Dactylosporangium vinaceum TaxID=53362 RepID=A0ABV5MJQ2_9ACTN|nr:hypothetical protein [Dactylosporangium vinaceum]UAB92643.1 PD40 domain-containing protein [Dactylosporangium vinaceum]
MTARLREAMREQARRAETYELYRGSLARARRARRHRRTAAALAIALVAAAGLALPLWLHRTAPVPAVPPPAGPSLPARIGAPPPGTGPLGGPASVAFGAGTWWQGASANVTAVVGAGRGDYGVVDNRAPLYAGEQAVLSPDGTRLAGEGRVSDLRTGTATDLPDLGPGTRTPQAWSPDGRWLAVIAYRTHPSGNEFTGATLHLVDPATGEHRPVADLNPHGAADGWNVAFAHHNSRWAYQSGNEIMVADITGDRLARFTVPPGTHLAGKGAWTPDDTALTLLGRHDSRWRLSYARWPDGAAAAGPALPELDGLAAVRLLGWSPAGAAVVAALYPKPGTPPHDFTLDQDTLPAAHTRLTAYRYVDAARILAVRPAPDNTLRVLVQGAEVYSIDAADDAVASGLERP